MAVPACGPWEAAAAVTLPGAPLTRTEVADPGAPHAAFFLECIMLGMPELRVTVLVARPTAGVRYDGGGAVRTAAPPHPPAAPDGFFDVAGPVATAAGVADQVAVAEDAACCWRSFSNAMDALMSSMYRMALLEELSLGHDTSNDGTKLQKSASLYPSSNCVDALST